jgi:2-phosphosulfolactate phosphatase
MVHTVRKSVVIDFLPESVSRYREGWAIVAVDVIRATTTAITAAATGRRCFPAPTMDAALELATHFDHPLLAGESGGKMPPAFELDNSPSQLAGRTDIDRPLVLVSSSGTKVIHEAAPCLATYLACFRSYSVLPAYLAGRHSRIAIIGAGSLGEFREEDQICCAWIAARLVRAGYQPEDAATMKVLHQWAAARPGECLVSRSVDYLARTDQLADLRFILQHVNDLDSAFIVEDGEVRMLPSVRRVSPQSDSQYPVPVTLGTLGS